MPHRSGVHSFSKPHPDSSGVIVVEEHDPGLLQRSLDFEHGREVALDQPIALFDALQRGQANSRQLRQFVLTQPQKGPSGPNLRRIPH
jgi:hypothetical protein